MGTCCIHTEANHRNCSPAPISNPCSIWPESPSSYPTPPPFSLHPHETKDVRPIIAHLPHQTKDLPAPSFRFFPKTKHLQRAPRVCIAKPNLRVNPVQSTRERNRLPHVIQPANPRHSPFDSHAKASVRNTAVTPQIEIPLEGFAWQLMLVNAAA